MVPTLSWEQGVLAAQVSAQSSCGATLPQLMLTAAHVTPRHVWMCAQAMSQGDVPVEVEVVPLVVPVTVVVLVVVVPLVVLVVLVVVVAPAPVLAVVVVACPPFPIGVWATFPPQPASAARVTPNDRAKPEAQVEKRMVLPPPPDIVGRERARGQAFSVRTDYPGAARAEPARRASRQAESCPAS
jgi:hypothetical protein